MANKRPTVYELEQTARQNHPGQSRWWYDKYAKMASKIIGWQRDYSGFQQSYGLDVVLLLVNEQDHTTRSPGKKQAIQDWRDTPIIAFLEGDERGG